MQLSPLSLMGGAYADNSLTWSAQRTVNWLPETAEVEGTRTPVKFADVPGLRAVVDLGTGSPIRGLENVEGKLFAVSGTSLFEVSTAFAATNRGNIPGVTRVSMAHNKQGGTVAANELVIANSLSGYVYNTDSHALVQITDEAFQGATTVDYVDGFITFTDPQGRFCGHSALNQATSYTSIDRYDAESAPDPIVSHIVSHREVMVFGTRTTEFFRNTGTATGTFQRVNGTELEIGICAPHARARVDNSVCWVSNDLEVLRLEGHAPQRISNRPIEQLLATVNPANIFCFPWEDRGHKVFYITAPEAFTIGFDFASGMWHERQTFELPRWRANALVSWNGYWIAGDYSNGLLYVLDWDTHHENGLPLVRERASGYTHGGQNKVRAPYVELLFETGTKDVAFEGIPPAITGDVPDGFIGQAVDVTYMVTGGVPPYGPITVASGALVPGTSMDDAGHVTGTRTTGGVASWTVAVTDANDDVATHPDTSETVDAGVWAISADLTGDDFAVGDWRAAAFPTTHPVPIQGYLFQFGADLYISNFTAVHFSSDAGANWTNTGAVGSASNGGGRMAFDGLYYFMAAGPADHPKRRLAAGAWANCGGVGATAGNCTQLIVHGDLVITNGDSGFTSKRKVGVTTDHGASWTYAGQDVTASINGAMMLASNGEILCAAYSDAADGNRVKIKWSDDNGLTWSASQITIPGAATPSEFQVLDGRWVVCTSAGRVAYADSHLGPWLLSATTTANFRQLAVGGAELNAIKFVGVSVDGALWGSTDHGATWAQSFHTSGSNAINGIAWIYNP